MFIILSICCRIYIVIYFIYLFYLFIIYIVLSILVRIQIVIIYLFISLFHFLFIKAYIRKHDTKDKEMIWIIIVEVIMIRLLGLY